MCMFPSSHKITNVKLLFGRTITKKLSVSSNDNFSHTLSLYPNFLNPINLYYLVFFLFLFLYTCYWSPIHYLVVISIFDCGFESFEKEKKDSKFIINLIDYDLGHWWFESREVVIDSVNEEGWDWNRSGFWTLNWKKSSSPNWAIGFSGRSDRWSGNWIGIFFFVFWVCFHCCVVCETKGCDRIDVEGVGWGQFEGGSLIFRASEFGSWMRWALAMRVRIWVAEVVVPMTYRRWRWRLQPGWVGGRGSWRLVLMVLWTSCKLCVLLWGDL